MADRFKQPEAMLVEMLEPSKVINEKFKAWQIEFESEDGLGTDTLVGIIAEETGDFVRLVANPLTDIDGTRIPTAKIKNRTAAPLSIMPTGLLNSYTKTDLFDLMAYLRSLPAAPEAAK